jgi:hypothetical protein
MHSREAKIANLVEKHLQTKEEEKNQNVRKMIGAKSKQKNGGEK